MAQHTYGAASVGEFLHIVDQTTKEWFPQEKTWGPWFRGQTDSSWPLRPGLYRHVPRHRSIRAMEDELRQEFIVRAPSLGPERPQNSWEWYFLMQHCGAPTRLLDWTESALIALFFAVRGKTGPNEQDGAVWILEPWKLNEFAVNYEGVIAPGAEAGLLSVDAQRFKPWLPDRYSDYAPLEKKYPAALYPTHFSRRISSQRSCFSIHGSELDGFDKLPPGFRPYLRRVVLPGSKAHEIETSLSVAGIDELTIFPDLDGLGRWLASVLREEASSNQRARRSKIATPPPP
jgi:hypothetical protein